MDFQSFWHLIGGIGLFLLGMSLMTDGLLGAGTQTLRRIVHRMTRSRWAGLATGFGVTAVVQSSSATTLMTVSFVSAGLVTFQQSIALILGANIGSTSTAWIVSLIGFKFSSAVFALPAVGIGALLRLVSRGRRQALGMAVAGFGLVFLGIDFMQAGMQTVAEHLRPEDIASEGFGGRLILVGIGIVMTVLMQSSSAAGAATLAAVHAGSITFEQAAALVIGQNIGTTVTAVIGSIGGTLSAKRAAMAHVMFNVLTAVIATLALDPFTALVHELGDGVFEGTPEGYVAMFHTGFNILGVAIFLPLLGPFARLVMRLTPDKHDHATHRLSAMTLGTAPLALEAARLTAMELGGRAIRAAIEVLGRAVEKPSGSDANLLERAARLVREPRRLLTGEDPEHATMESRLAVLHDGLDRLRTHLGGIGRLERGGPNYREYLAIMYASDHIQRVVHLVRVQTNVQLLGTDDDFSTYVHGLNAALVPIADTLLDRADAETPMTTPEDDVALGRWVDALRTLLEHHRVVYRGHLLARTAAGQVTPAEADELLDTNRWLVDIGHSASRLAELLVWPTTAARELADLPTMRGAAETTPST